VALMDPQGIPVRAIEKMSGAAPTFEGSCVAWTKSRELQRYSCNKVPNFVADFAQLAQSRLHVQAHCFNEAISSVGFPIDNKSGEFHRCCSAVVLLHDIETRQRSSLVRPKYLCARRHDATVVWEGPERSTFRGSELLHSVSALLLGAIERTICLLQERFRRAGARQICGSDSHADGDCNLCECSYDGAL